MFLLQSTVLPKCLDAFIKMLAIILWPLEQFFPLNFFVWLRNPIIGMPSQKKLHVEIYRKSLDTKAIRASLI